MHRRSLVGSHAVPADRFGIVFRHALAGVVHEPEAVLRPSVPLLSLTADFHDRVLSTLPTDPARHQLKQMQHEPNAGTKRSGNGGLCLELLGGEPALGKLVMRLFWD